MSGPITRPGPGPPGPVPRPDDRGTPPGPAARHRRAGPRRYLVVFFAVYTSASTGTGVSLAA